MVHIKLAPCLPRLILVTLLNMGSRALALFAPDCSSWGIPCRSTSMRSFVNPLGYEGYEFVKRSNLMISRNLGWSYYFPYKGFIMAIKYQSSSDSAIDSIHPHQLRLALALLVVLCQCCFFLVEQPSQSLLHRHPRMDWLVNRVAWESRFWFSFSSLGFHMWYHAGDFWWPGFKCCIFKSS